MNNWFDSPTQHYFWEWSKALSITMAVLIFAIVLTITRRAVNYLFNRAEYLRESIWSWMKWVVIIIAILVLLLLFVLFVINILGKYQVEKENTTESKNSKA
jgi:heme/copper-type cytochrome/quinol oxidase subunit 2